MFLNHLEQPLPRISGSENHDPFMEKMFRDQLAPQRVYNDAFDNDRGDDNDKCIERLKSADQKRACKKTDDQGKCKSDDTRSDQIFQPDHMYHTALNPVCACPDQNAIK